MKARFEISYYYLPGEETPCRAVTTITLPAQEGLLVPLLRSAKDRIHQRLTGGWGTYQNEEARSVQISVYADSWEELEQEVNNQIASIVSLLQRVVANNLRMLEQKPADRAIEINLKEEQDGLVD